MLPSDFCCDASDKMIGGKQAIIGSVVLFTTF